MIKISLHACLLSVLVSCGCAAQRRSAQDEAPISAPVLPAPAPSPTPRTENREIATWLAQVRTASSTAKAARAAQDPQRQTSALAMLRTLAQEPPSVIAALPEAPSIRRGLLGQAAHLALELQRFDDTQALVREGLALPGHDAFRTQLLIVSAEAHHARGDTKAEANALKLAREELAIADDGATPTK